MFSRLRDFIYRHRRKFLVTGVVVGGTVLAIRYASRKLREYSESEAREFMERSRRQQHFRSTERTCDQTILSLSPTIHEAIMKCLNTEELVAELQCAPAEKVVIWEKLKVKACSRVTVLVYANAMLVLLIRVQLNVVGGYLVRDPNNEASFPPELQQLYLSLCHHLRDSGVKQLCELVERHVGPIMDSISLKKPFSLRDIEELFWSVQNSIESNIHENPIKTMGRYVIPTKERVNVDGLDECEVRQLYDMMAETVDILESDEVVSLMRSCVSQSFANVVDKLADHFVPRSSVEPVPGPSSEQDSAAWTQAVNGSFIHPSTVTIPFAKLIPIINKLTEQANSRKDSWAHHLLRNELVKVFGANVYEAYGQRE